MNVFITGVSSGLGRALTNEFLTERHKVWGVARRKIEAWDNDGRLTSNGSFRFSVCDVSVMADAERVRAQMKEAGFVPDIVVLNAGVMENDLDGTFSYDVFKKTYAINLFGAVAWLDLFLPVFVERDGGTFVAISSLSSYRGLNNKKIAYSGSKAALSMTFECMRLQMTPSKVRFVTVNPGGMSPDESRTGLLKIHYKSAAQKIVRRLASPGLNGVFDFPFLNAFISKTMRFLPDFLVSRIVKRCAGS
ncbi:MAG: SDR family oxidoreductase [Deltaproteobacteria bacterium]|nr:SDR family oxidoreductase [Deltaproteobacteria bacterium]